MKKIDHLNEELMAYTLSEAELEMIHENSTLAQVKSYYELWTMKEAIYKTELFPNATPQSLDKIGWK